MLARRRNQTLDLRWINGFVRNIRPHVFVRERDGLLILMPNQSYPLNRTGLHLLGRTLAGESINRALDRVLPRDQQTDERIREVHDFFMDLRALIMGCMMEGYGRRAVERIPFDFKPGVLPVLSEIAVTYRCNLACRFCYAGCSCTRGNAVGEMTPAEIETVMRRIRHEAEVPSVSFTGGEPTLRTDLPRLVRSAVRIGLRVNLITNATLITDSLARELRKTGLRSAQVSVEGPNAEIHDMLTTVPGSFDRTIEGIETLKKHDIYVHTNTTINRLNAPHLQGIADLAKSLDMPRFSMNMVMPCGTAGTGDTSLRYTEVGDLVHSVKRRARDLGIEFMWYSPTPYCIFHPVASGLGRKACAACDGLLSVAPNGDVLPCSSVSTPVGNLLRDTFETVWNSERSLFYRNRDHAPGVCRDCAQFDLCSGACPIYWEAFGCNELAPSR